MRDAATAGAVGTVWPICAALVSALIARRMPCAGGTKMLRLAELCAHSLGVRQQIEGGDGPGFVTAERALHTAVAPVLWARRRRVWTSPRETQRAIAARRAQCWP
ncbi:MAG: hypothetical protein HOV79_19300 [Hamadaea sp.]|nr:hypothetical protein [Hamadaea sp.]